MSTVPRPWAPYILIVDDNRDFADSLSRLLEAWSFQPRVAYDGPSAVEAALTQTPDAILLDIGLPSMDGFEVARQLRQLELSPRLLLVALTGYGQAEDVRRSREAGFDHHLVKPVDLEELRRLLAALACSSARLNQVPRRSGHTNEVVQASAPLSACDDC